MIPKNFLRLATLLAAMALTGCASIAPQRPLETPVNLTWSDYLSKQQTVANSAIDDQWWQQFGDPMLTSLIREATVGNIDLAIATSRLVEARANRRAALAGFGPNANLSASTTAQRQSENGILPVKSIPDFKAENVIFDAGFDVSWELDVFGRNSIRAAQSNADVALREAQRDEAIVSLLSEVARNYIELRQLQGERVIVLRKVVLQQERLDMTLRKQQVGKAASPDVELEVGQLNAMQATIPDLDAQIRAKINSIAILLGQQPDALHARLQPATELPAAPAIITTGLTSDLLRRRPDVRAAEYQYASAESGRRLSALALYPTFSLLGSVGLESTNLTDLLDPGSIAANLGALLSWSLFEGGRKNAQVAAASERSTQAALSYRGAVLGALEDVETHAARYVEAGRQANDLTNARKNRERLVEYAVRRFDAGTNNRFDVISAQTVAADAELLWLNARSQQLLNLVSLHKALGGGWLPSEVAD